MSKPIAQIGSQIQTRSNMSRDFAALRLRRMRRLGTVKRTKFDWGVGYEMIGNVQTFYVATVRV
jgi:hypothetical protein